MRKSDQVCARVTPAVMATLRALAGRHHLLLSEFIRRLIAEGLDRLTTDEAGGRNSVVPHRPDTPVRYR